MKSIKIIFFLMINLVLFSCDNAKQSSDNKASNNPNAALQDSVIDPIKSALPIEIDSLTTLFGVYKDKDTINYQYRVINTPEQALLLTTTLSTIRMKLLKAYCENNKDMQDLKTAFPQGANYHYFIDDKEVVIIELTPADCQLN
ncbi:MULTISPECIES: hypothetical protein [unclassified Gilliamella]|uniref:hypothetical protein n=1 Tax=unclassified Gilliamella TaxID=2685620 RepID=UPI00226A9827|nr:MULTISPECIES: hypothetical protein [unclassified Gilliamella]MCX8600652.1 hypothetical protein [Gilliamella sp. B3722]MCX8609192.1 hypothetical protein [Gilliamella sp. B3771]MCX8609869.1 hypothetical protein [Gilliamella sp. B3891]MCX8612041.1 hypothetical protein [Gilliamella sp. B3773]MCX8615545.1 hypothetical protein [Gilliamella sp. B3770]